MSKTSIRATWVDYPWPEILVVAAGLAVQVFLMPTRIFTMDLMLASGGFIVCFILAAFAVGSMNPFETRKRSGDDPMFLTMATISAIAAAVLIALAVFFPILTWSALALWAVAILRAVRMATLGHRLNQRPLNDGGVGGAPKLRGRRRAA